MTESTPPKTRPLRLILALVGVALVLIAALTWLNRRMLAREALTGWLRSKGVAAEAQVEAFGPSTFIARLRVGDARNPDFAAERVEVRYRLRLTRLDVVSVTLRKPVLRAQLRRDGLHVGALDPLVQEFLRRPPRPDAAKPRVAIDDGVLHLATDYGPVRLTADALVEDARLRTLAATSAPARLRGQGFDIALGAGTLKAATTGDRIDLSLSAPADRATLAGATVSDARFSLNAKAPYPDLEKRRGDGAVSIRALLTAGGLTAGDQRLAGARLTAAFDGQASGWIPTLAVAGAGRADLTAKGASLGASRSGAVQASVAADDLRWDRKAGDLVTATLRTRAMADGIVAGDLTLPQLDVRGGGPLRASPASVQLDARLAAQGRGRWSGLGRPLAEDSADIAAIKRAARAFRISAPDVRLDLNSARPEPVQARLGAPLRLLPDTGGEVRLTSLAAPARLTVSGGGLPDVDVAVRRLDLGPSPFADLTVRTALSVGPVQRGRIDAAGRLRFGEAGVSFTAERCIAVQAERLELGENDVEDLAGRLCPAGGPVFAVRDGAWRFAARAEAMAASVPFAQVRIDSGAASITASGAGPRLTARAQIATVRLADTTPEARFNPLRLSGDATFSGGVLKADLSARLPGGPTIATAQLTQDTGQGRGGIAIQTPELAFAEGGLQPDQISPMAGALGSPAVGSARFQGRFDWTADGVTSGGTLTVPRLDFTSPAGPIKGLKGVAVFSSLAPLTTAPGQELTVDTVETIVLVEHLRARFEIADNLIRVAGSEAEVGGGKVRLETLEIPLTPGAPSRGVLVVEGVQLHDLVEASPFGDKVEFDAKVSGRIPFEANGTRIRITGGELKAIQPGRISINRTALTGVQAEGEIKGPVEAPAPNDTFTDFAYQAMENLAFDKMAATISSREDGRLGVLFHIIGRHDPPQKQRIRLTIMDLIQRKFLGRKLPLPSGTGVNLTLDTTLNLDDLLADYAEYQKAKSSAPVQP